MTTLKTLAAALLAGAMLLACGPAHAQTALPAYDVDGMCAARGLKYGEDVKRCVYREQQAYDRLKETWDSYLPQTQNWCVRDHPSDLGYAGLEIYANGVDQGLRPIVELKERQAAEAAGIAAQSKFKP